jgi:hypothetical protein
MRIVPLIFSLEYHQKMMASAPQAYRPSRCPKCGLAGLWGHGSFERKPDRDEGALNPIEVPRYLCGKKDGCGTTCSTLPSCVPPRRWYPWKAQQLVLVMLLEGASIRGCAARCDRARRTVGRWWRWLREQHERFSFHLLSLRSEWGRFDRWERFWQRALEDRSLDALMASLDQAGVAVP